LISPYLRLSQTLSERLHDVAERGVEIVIVFGKSELQAGEHAARLRS
jgi:hypothetical protein